MKPVTYSTTNYREQGELLKMLLEFWSPGGEFFRGFIHASVENVERYWRRHQIFLVMMVICTNVTVIEVVSCVTVCRFGIVITTNINR